ncbi:MAG: hypothetical protein M8353_01760 [ANME-2 cluster archaeon]|nr:hypothetical protein [ANME-2 cluster archaeon]
MPDIGLIWDSRLLFEKLFVEHGFDYRLIHPASLGSHFVPKCKLVIIPTGFANLRYSSVLPSLMRNRQRIDNFITAGGTLLVYGALTEFHDYDWLSVKIEYVQRYGPAELSEHCHHKASMIIADTRPECDGFFTSCDGNCIMMNESREPVLVAMEYGNGQIIATTIHEFPTPEFIRWALDCSTSASL